MGKNKVQGVVNLKSIAYNINRIVNLVLRDFVI